MAKQEVDMNRIFALFSDGETLLKAQRKLNAARKQVDHVEILSADVVVGGTSIHAGQVGMHTQITPHLDSAKPEAGETLEHYLNTKGLPLEETSLMATAMRQGAELLLVQVRADQTQPVIKTLQKLGAAYISPNPL